MTRDELITKLNTAYIMRDVSDIYNLHRALRAVVELHKPAFARVDGVKGSEWCYQCAEGRGYAKWPCPTIQAIEKVFK
jgi:hypothetical protein